MSSMTFAVSVRLRLIVAETMPEGICVCVLAYNEEKRITPTLRAVTRGANSDTYDIVLYPNGCTDGTVAAARTFALEYPRLKIRILKEASKCLAWNTAFAENRYEFLVFADGDVEPEEGAVLDLVGRLQSDPDAVVASCRQAFHASGITLQQKLVGFMQLPLHQDYLAGGFYAVRREALAALMHARGLSGIPAAVTGDDQFVENLVGYKSIIVSKAKSYYVPPNFADYTRYLARLKWQRHQARNLECLAVASNSNAPGFWLKLKRKWRGSPSTGRFLLGFFPVAIRSLFKIVAGPIVYWHYRRLLRRGRSAGDTVLVSETRASSTK